MRVLLFGGSGQLGSDILRLWTADDIAAPSSEELDVEQFDQVEAAIREREPQVVVNCTAFHHVERCEREPGKAFSVNALAVEAMARASREAGARFLTFSTDYVFDGTSRRPYREDDVPSPLSVYGISKYSGELLVRRLQSDALVVRVCGLYGTRVSSSKGYTFVDRIIAQARAGDELRVVSDQTVSPTYSGDVARMLRAVVESGARGTVHMVNEGAVSWYEFASEALRAAGIEAEIEPVSYTAWASPVRRPEYSALENARLSELGLRMPGWRAGLASYLRDKTAT